MEDDGEVGRLLGAMPMLPKGERAEQYSRTIDLAERNLRRQQTLRVKEVEFVALALRDEMKGVNRELTTERIGVVTACMVVLGLLGLLFWMVVCGRPSLELVGNLVALCAALMELGQRSAKRRDGRRGQLVSALVGTPAELSARIPKPEPRCVTSDASDPADLHRPE